MIRRVVVVVLLLLAIAGGLAAVKALQINTMIENGKNFVMPPEAVSSAVVEEASWQSAIEAVGSVAAVQGVHLRAEIPGTVREIAFESGGRAEQGQVLVRLDTEAEQAQLQSVLAQADLAERNVARARDLFRQELISRAELDAREAEFRSSSSAVENIRAAIAKKTIRAPFSGRLGIREVNLGQYVDAGAPVVSLQSLDPVYVDFTLPEQQLANIRRGMPVRVTVDAAAGRTFEGRLTAADPDVDPATRNVQLQATLPNPDGALRPGMFARVDVVLPQTRTELVIPATAVLHAPYGDSVFVIKEQKNEQTGQTQQVVEMTTVRLGETRGDFVAVTKGLQPGQSVVSAGVFKLRNGTPVAVDNSLKPQLETNPRPADS